MLMPIVPSIATITPNLLQVATTGESSDPDGHPSQLAHEFSQTAARASTAAVLRDFQDIEHGLRGDAFDTVVADPAAKLFETSLPRIDIRSVDFGPSLSKPFHP
jgi:hypothetical protein